MSKDLIVKGNKLIEASYRLSLTEMRLVLKMASVIRKEDSEFSSYRFAVRDLLAEFSMHAEDHGEIKKATAGLISKVMRIEDAEQKRELQISFISSAEYLDSQGIVELSFDSKLKPYLLQLRKNFTSFQLSTVKRLGSVYTVRIYELAKQFEKIGTRRLQLDELKRMLGIDSGHYRQYGHFKQRVLRPALKEINKHTDLSVEMREIKFGRRVEVIELHMKKSQRQPWHVQRLNALAESKRAA